MRRHKKMTGERRDTLIQQLFRRWTRRQREISLTDLHTKLTALGLFEGFDPSRATAMISIALGFYHPELERPYGIVVDTV
jgi:hypothetical protein